MIDFFVVGSGLAGISFCEVLEKNGKTFKLFNDDSQVASKVAGGLYNPVILKRFTAAWKAKEQLALITNFYKGLETKLGVKLDFKLPVLRRFASIEEQNLWFEKADDEVLFAFLDTNLVANTNDSLDAPLGYGIVRGTGRIHTKVLLEHYRLYGLDKDFLREETFDYTALKSDVNGIHYKNIQAKYIVFAEGFGLKRNPFFQYLPLNGTKGELLTIEAPELKETSVIKSSVFSIPLGKDRYRIGATYKWKDKTNTPTWEARKELLEKLERFLKCKYKVVEQVAGIRPTVVDRTTQNILICTY